MTGERGRWLLLATAVAQAAAPSVIGFDQDAGNDPVIVPPGPFFGVWGLVVLGSLASAVWGLRRERATTAPYRRIQLPVSGVQTGFVLWLIAADRKPVLTLPVFLVMLALLIPSLRAVLGERSDRITRVLLGATLGVYAGWATAAVWLNAVTVASDVGLELSGAAGTFVMAAGVAGAAGSACLGTRLLGAQPAYVLATAWALLGVLLSTSTQRQAPLAAIAALGLLAVAAVGINTRWRRRQLAETV